MAKGREISMEDFQKMGGARQVSKTGQQADRLLAGLNPNRPILIPGASRGLQVALSRRVNKMNDVMMKVEKEGDKRNIALLKKG